MHQKKKKRSRNSCANWRIKGLMISYSAEIANSKLQLDSIRLTGSVEKNREKKISYTVPASLVLGVHPYTQKTILPWFIYNLTLFHCKQTRVGNISGLPSMPWRQGIPQPSAIDRTLLTIEQLVYFAMQQV